MELMNVKKLKSHKDNTYFFDDMAGEAWIAFLESVKTSGVIEPVIVTSDLVIVSGHQRVRACKELGIEKVMVDIRKYDSDDEVLKQLIETNIRQRGIGNTNPVKFGRCVAELERIYGIKAGRPSKETSNNVGNKTQEELIDELGINKETYRQAKKLASLPEEIQQLVTDGYVSASTASRLIAKLHPAEQQQLALQLAPERKYTQRDVQNYIDKIHELESKQPEVVTKTVEKIPSDYESIKADYKRMVNERQQYADDLREANKKIHDLESKKEEVQSQIQLEQDAETFIIQTYQYIKKCGGLIWIMERMENLPEEKQSEFKQAAVNIFAFADGLMKNMGGFEIE